MAELTRNNTFTINSEEDTIFICFELPSTTPIYVEAIDKVTLKKICFQTFACDNLTLLEDVKQIKSFTNFVEENEFIILLEILGFI